MAREVEAARLIVEMCDPEAFLAGFFLGEAAGEELPRSRKAVEGDGDIGTLMEHFPVLSDARPANDWNESASAAKYLHSGEMCRQIGPLPLTVHW